ncbi:MAG: hypothetical protein AAFX87_01155 [Bacteroidota bacterium]
MEEIIIYVIIAVIALISRTLGKKKQNPAPPNNGGGSSAPPKQRRTQKPVTFEDLLREFTGEKVEEEREIDEPAPRPTTSRSPSYERTATYEPDIDDDEIEDVYQRSIRSAQTLKQKKEPTANVGKKGRPKFKKFEVYEEHTEERNNIVEMLRNAQGARNAIILSEILNRKY